MCFTVQLSKIGFALPFVSNSFAIISCRFLPVKNFFQLFWSCLCFSLAATLISYHIQPAVVKNFFISFLQLFVRRNSFMLSRVFSDVKNFFSFLSINAEGGIWTLAPLLTTYSLSRGAPSASLGTSPRAERVGFEPTRPFGQTVFKTASLWPLRYLSKIPNCRFQQAIKLYRICDVDYSIIALHEMSTLFYHFFRYFFHIHTVY